MKLLLTFLAVGQMQLIDYNTAFSSVSSTSNYWKHNKAPVRNFEFFRRKMNKFRGMYNQSNNEKSIEKPVKKSRLGRSSKKVNTAVKSIWYSPIVLMYEWYGSCQKRLINIDQKSETY